GALARLPGVRLADCPRMADFAVFGAAVERALGWHAGSFAAAYADNLQTGHALALEASPVVQPLLHLAQGIARGEEWKGTAKELLDELMKHLAEGTCVSKSWPRTPRKLSGDLRRLKPNLKAVGVQLIFERDPSSRSRERIIHVKRVSSRDGADGA